MSLTPAAEASANIFDLGSIEVSLTYPFLNAPPIVFHLRPILNREEKELRQSFLGLDEDAREAAKHDANVELLASLSVRPPENLPAFAESVESLNTSLKDDLKAFFSGENAMKRKVVEDALTIYFGLIQPAEFFRGF